ncbi:hypothetical protein N7539_000146 [Penicillium diatomitis]|uniref:Methyltransferase domain-containing protein n=1 Tax=Penicillium diatomitis TaxID=2819901 RepID=A0A9W9XLZ6_9EURO|nr:uncharacterized protein N7539_000146 [Penicillium diatomitis]KAJ5495030.1 hypothetical protein N7539_000146 [Penicillium diatomitis]
MTTQDERASEGPPPWYETDVKSINPKAQSLLEEYSGFAPDEVLPHVLKLRDEAFKIFPYPCIGQMRFLSCHLSNFPYYQRIHDKLHSRATGTTFLDAGCCVGQELRFLHTRAQVPAENLYGLDLEPEFFSIGYELFRDNAATFPATLVAADIQADEDTWAGSRAVTAMKGRMDVIWASSFLHLWDYEGQARALERLLGLCRDETGVVVGGRQMGSVLAGEYTVDSIGGRKEWKQYRHNGESLKGLWFDVERRLGQRWELEVQLENGETMRKMRGASFMDDQARVIWWIATRVS